MNRNKFPIYYMGIPVVVEGGDDSFVFADTNNFTFADGNNFVFVG